MRPMEMPFSPTFGPAETNSPTVASTLWHLVDGGSDPGNGVHVAVVSVRREIPSDLGRNEGQKCPLAMPGQRYATRKFTIASKSQAMPRPGSDGATAWPSEISMP